MREKISAFLKYECDRERERKLQTVVEPSRKNAKLQTNKTVDSCTAQPSITGDGEHTACVG